MDKVNADPARQARVSALVQKARERYSRSLTFWQTYKPVYVRNLVDMRWLEASIIATSENRHFAFVILTPRSNISGDHDAHRILTITWLR